MFSDFTAQPNKNACYTYIGKELERDMGNMGYVFLTCGTFVFCAWFCSFGLCFRDKTAKELREHIRAKKYIMEGTIDNSDIGDFNSQVDGINDITKGGGDEEGLVNNHTNESVINQDKSRNK